MEKAKALNILKSLCMTKLQMMVHMFTSYMRSLMQLHHGNIWPIIHNIQKMKKSSTLNWNPCQNEKLIILQRFSVKLSLSICCTRVTSTKHLLKSMLSRSILYCVKVTKAGAKSGILLWRTPSSDNACFKNKPVFSQDTWLSQFERTVSEKKKGSSQICGMIQQPRHSARQGNLGLCFE